MWRCPTKVPEMYRPERVKGQKLMRGRPITPKQVSRIVSRIGKAAGVVVNKTDGKFASPNYSYVREFLDLRGYLSC